MNPEYNDMILPEGFDPELGDQNFDDDGNIIEAAPAVEPTTAPAPEAKSDEQVKTNETVETAEPTTVPETTPTQPVQEAPAAEEAPKATPEVKPTVKVRYNHTDRELSLEEAAVFAQKGLNYDRIDQRSKEQEAKLSKYEEMAKVFGYENADAMMTQAEQNYIDVKVQSLVEQGNTEAMARFLVQQEVAKIKASMPAAPKTNDPLEAPRLTPERKAEIEEFNTAYPDVKEIPDEVFAMHRDGMKLKTAYDFYQTKQALEAAKEKEVAAQKELAILKQNQAAAAKAPVTGTIGKAAPKSAAEDEANDPFLIGWNKA